MRSRGLSVSVYKDKRYPGQWAVSFMVQGVRYRKRGFRTRREAQLWEAAERERVLSPPRQTPTASFASLANRYLEHCAARMGKNTVRYKATHFRRFAQWLGGDYSVELLTKNMVGDFLLHVAGTSGNKQANRTHRDLFALFNWAVQGELTGKNPARSWVRFPEDPFHKYVPPVADVEAVILAADPDETDLLETLYYTGGRIGEVLAATWEDVNFERREIVLCTRKRKGGELQRDKVPIPEALVKTLARRYRRRGGDGDGAHIFHFTVHRKRYLLHHLCDRAKVRRFGYHGIRHHVASILADSGKATLRQVQQFLRHRRPTTTEHYLHEVTRDQREVVEILEIARKGEKQNEKDHRWKEV
jgi:integrase